MAWKIHLLRYNNYYNRQLKKYNGLDEYLQHEIAPLDYSINFNIKDGITNEVIINGWKSESPDYCIVVNEDDNTFTRWFVMTTQYITSGQYKITLKRDVLAEYSTEILNTDCYVEKGSVSSTDYLALNKENLDLNQIKQNEIQLYDKSGVPWVAIFFNGNVNIKDKEFVYNIPIYKTISGTTINEAIRTMDDNLANWINKHICFTDKVDTDIPSRFFTSYNVFNKTYSAYNGKYIRFNDTSTSTIYYYKINFQKFYDSKGLEYWRLYLLIIDSKFTLGTVKYSFTSTGTILMIPFSDMIFDTNFVASLAKNIQLSAGSSVIADVQLLPYNPLFNSRGINRYHNTNTYNSTDNYNSSDYFGILPEFKFTVTTLSETSAEFQLYGSIQYKNSSLENLSLEITIPSFDFPFDIKEHKNCYSYRLCSPNYAAAFDFNYADMCAGSIANLNYLYTFNVDLSYKPYTSYIHVTPYMSGLYGKDFNDSRGLICGGDFSLEQASSEWANYQLNNKTYQQQFDRQIQNMQVSNAWNTAESILGIGTAGISGAVGGAIVGGGAGAIAGGVAGLVGGTLDVAKTISMQNETLNYTKDMYNYNLQNIQSLPTTTTKISSLNGNNKLVPFLEIYSCSDIEKTAFRNKIKYNGMTINVIGKLKDYIYNKAQETYVKGKIIRIEDFNDDYHMITEIGNEVNKGFFIIYNNVEK